MFLFQDLTAALYESLSENTKESIKMLGVDLDDKLVERAVTNFTIEDKLEFKPLDIMSDTFTEDIGQFLQKYNKTKFDLVTVFSVTMWVGTVETSINQTFYILLVRFFWWQII